MVDIASMLLSQKGGHPAAVSVLKRARALRSELGDTMGEVEVLAAIIDAHIEADEIAEAFQLAQEAVTVAAGDKKAKGAALLAMSAVHLVRGNDIKAMTRAKEAAENSKDAGDVAGQASALGFLAEVYLSRNNPNAALEHAMEALKLCKGARHTEIEASAQFMCGNAHLMMDKASDQGIAYLRSAASSFRAAGDVRGMSHALHALTDAHLGRSCLEEGLSCAWEALACYRRLGDTGNKEALKQTIKRVQASLRKPTNPPPV